jgi:hypothetical protein
MQTIFDTDFKHDWNTREGKKDGKLELSVFTTLRLYSDKYKENAIHRIWNNHNGKKRECKGYAVVIRRVHFQLKDIEKFDILCRLDTGYSFSETRNILSKMYTNIHDPTWFCFAVMRYLTHAEIVSFTEKNNIELPLN